MSACTGPYRVQNQGDDEGNNTEDVRRGHARKRDVIRTRTWTSQAQRRWAGDVCGRRRKLEPGRRHDSAGFVISDNRELREHERRRDPTRQEANSQYAHLGVSE